MKAVIFAGGLGTRLMEETTVRPKPMVEVGGKPILSHILQIYASQRVDDFVIAAGYKHEVIEAYYRDGRLQDASGLDANVTVVDTGDTTQTGGRLLRLAPLLRDHGTFMASYGDGLADVDIEALLRFHRAHGRIATLTAVHPPTPHGRLDFDDSRVLSTCSPAGDSWINGGYFVFEPAIFDYLSADEDVLETHALSRLAQDGEMMAYRHEGFWQCMDTLPERRLLEDLWRGGRAPWSSRPSPALAATI